MQTGQLNMLAKISLLDGRFYLRAQGTITHQQKRGKRKPFLAELLHGADGAEMIFFWSKSCGEDDNHRIFCDSQ